MVAADFQVPCVLKFQKPSYQYICNGLDTLHGGNLIYPMHMLALLKAVQNNSYGSLILLTMQV